MEPQIKTIEVPQEPIPPLPGKEKRGRGRKFILLILLICLGVFFVFKYKESQPTNAVAQQLSLLKENKIERAYNITSMGFKEETPREVFNLFIEQHPSLKNNKSYSFPEKSIKKDTIILKGELTAEDGMKTPIKYKIVKEEGKWKIEGIEISQVEKTK